jgi:hypothetical protein
MKQAWLRLRAGRGSTRSRLATVGAAALLSAATLVACGGPRKKHVTKEDMQTVAEYVDRNMRASSVAPDDRKRYVASQLGAPHRTADGMQYWYTTVLDCYYFQVGEDGWASWGIGATSDCGRWAVAK